MEADPYKRPITKARLHLELVPASREDFLHGREIRLGKEFYLKNSQGSFEGPYFLNEHLHISTGDFKAWREAGMIYIRINHAEARVTKPS